MGIRPLPELCRHLVGTAEAGDAVVCFMPLDPCGRNASGEEILRELTTRGEIEVRSCDVAADARGLARLGLGMGLTAVLLRAPGELKAAVLGVIDLCAAISENGHDLDLRGADLRGASLVKSSLRGVVLDGASLERAHLRSSDLSCASLDGTDFAAATLRSTNLSESHGSFANFERADLTAAGLNSVEFRQCTFVRADLDSAFVKQARFLDCHFDEDARQALVARGADA